MKRDETRQGNGGQQTRQANQLTGSVARWIWKSWPPLRLCIGYRLLFGHEPSRKTNKRTIDFPSHPSKLIGFSASNIPLSKGIHARCRMLEGCFSMDMAHISWYPFIMVIYPVSGTSPLSGTDLLTWIFLAAKPCHDSSDSADSQITMIHSPNKHQ